MTIPITSLINSQNERIEIKKINSGDFDGQYLLVIHDDRHVSNVKALHLLDESTVRWLLKELPKL